MDAAWLWGLAPLPEGLTLASYAHRGAYPLVVTALLAVLSPEEFGALGGRTTEFRGRYRTSITTGLQLSAGTLAPTTRLATQRGILELSTLPPSSGALAGGDFTVLRRFPESGRGLDLFLRDADTGRRMGTLFVFHRRTSLSYLLQLPTLARPFEWDRVELRLPGNARNPLPPARARVEMYEIDPAVRDTVDADVTFVMPSEATPAER